jgi:hypothetical protein
LCGSSSRWRRSTSSTIGMCLSQEVYVDSGNIKKVLHLLCIGLTADNNNNAPLFSFDWEPEFSP